MKAALIASFGLLAASLAHAEEDPFADPAPAPPRPERKISSLPKSVTYEAKDGSHIYTISGIYVTSPEHEIDDPGSLSEAFIPDCEDCTFDFRKRTCTITTSRKLTFSELAYAIDDIAGMCGDLPYWFELEARDLPASEEFAGVRFAVEAVEGAHPKRLGWFWLPDDKPFEIPFAFGPNQTMKVLIVPTTAFCMCHSRYCIRILDESGKLVWQDNNTAYAGISVAVTDQDEDFVHELLIRRHDHGKDARFRIKLSSEQDGADQPATTPESKPEGNQNPKPASEARPQ